MGASPIVRWVGGKKWLAPLVTPTIRAYLQSTNGRYLEPFLGGGAVALDLALPDMILGDACGPLINCFKQATQHPGDVYWLLELLKMRGIDSKAYYQIRAEHPRSIVEKAARFLYLNALSYNGVYRENSKGEYNVPYGVTENKPPTFVTVERLKAFADALAGAQLHAQDFYETLRLAAKGDAVYVDSPYYGVYSSYLKGKFTEHDHADLAHLLREARDRGVAWVATNNNTVEVRHLYKWALMVPTEEVRRVNRDGKGRGKTDCLLIASSADLLPCQG